MSNRARHLRGLGRRKPAPGVAARVDWSHPLVRGMTCCWLMNEGAGSFAGSGRNLIPGGVALGDAAAQPASAPAVFGLGRQNTTSTYYGFQSAVTVCPPSAGTFLLWYRPDTAVTTNAHYPYRCQATSPVREFDLVPYTDGQTYAGWYNSGEYRVVVATPADVAKGLWAQHVITWVSGGTTAYYVNGRPLGTASGTSTFDDAAIGKAFGYDSGGTYDQGTFDHAAVWSRALSAAEVAWLYNEPFAFLLQPAPRRSFFGPAAAGAGMVIRRNRFRANTLLRM